MNTHVVDQKARDMAQAAASAIDKHEQVCVERWGSAMSTMQDIKRIIGWGFGLLIVTGISLIGYLWTHPVPH